MSRRPSCWHDARRVAGVRRRLRQLGGLIAAIAQDPAARQLLDSEDDPGQALEAMRALDGDTGAAMSDYLDLVGCRLLDGFDISGRYALELPDALLRAIRVVGRGADTSLRRRTSDRRRPRTGAREHRASSTSCSGRRG